MNNLDNAKKNSRCDKKKKRIRFYNTEPFVDGNMHIRCSGIIFMFV